MEKIVIAIDGHSSCGKSTFAKQIAKQLDYLYIDSGAMYRAVTLALLRQGAISKGKVDEEILNRLLPKIKIDFHYNRKIKAYETMLNGSSVENEIRSPSVANSVSIVAAIPQVRERMVALQQELGKHKGIVMDGRDIGTVVFPNAELKIFMTADAEIRAQRRFDELKETKTNITFEEVLANIRERDHIDQTREVSPLRQADDAVMLDSSHTTIPQQIRWVMGLIEERFK